MKIILTLFVISTLLSQTLMDVFSTLLCGYLTWVHFKNTETSSKTSKKAWLLPKMEIEWLWAAWFIIVALGYLTNQLPPEAPQYLWLLRLIEFKWIIILYFLLKAFRQIQFTESNMNWLMGAYLAMSSYALVDYARTMLGPHSPGERLGGIFEFSMTYAHLYGIYFAFIVGLLLMMWPKLSTNRKLFYLATLSVSGITLLLTYTRGVWIAVFLATIVMGFLWNFKRGLILLGVACSTVLVLFFSVPTIRDRIIFTTKVHETYDSERLALWTANWMMFKDYPAFGVGYAYNKHHLREYYDQLGYPENQYIGHAHNQYIQFLSGTGLFGLGAYVGVLFFFLLRTVQAFKRLNPKDLWLKGLALGSIGGQLIFILGGLTEANFEHSKVRFVAMLMWALGLWLYQTHGKPVKAK